MWINIVWNGRDFKNIKKYNITTKRIKRVTSINIRNDVKYIQLCLEQRIDYINAIIYVLLSIAVSFTYVFVPFSPLYFRWKSKIGETADRTRWQIINGRNKAEFNPWIAESLGRYLREEKETRGKFEKMLIRLEKTKLNNSINDINIGWNDFQNHLEAWIKYCWMERSIDFRVIRLECNRIETKIEAFQSILLLKKFDNFAIKIYNNSR